MMAALLGAAALAALCLVLACSLLASLFYPLRRESLQRLDPAARARRVLLWTASPLLLGILLTALCLLPSALAGVSIGTDHCPEHDDHHPHLCLLHPPHGRAFGAAAFAPLAAATALLAAAARQLVRSSRLIRSLRGLSAADTARDGVLLVATEEPLSFTAGLLTPRVFLSRGIVAALPASSLDLVIEHERAHVRRRDPLLWWMASTLSRLHLPWTRRLLLADFALACEQDCDRSAALQSGDPVRVAEALLRVERLLGARRSRFVTPAMSFGGSDVDARVRHLLDPTSVAASGRRWTYVLAAAALLAAADPLHHLTETALGLLTR